jgi:hypothetical protein
VALTGPPRMEARRLVAPWIPAVHAHGQGQSDHPPRLRAVAGTAAINWRRWSDRSVTFSVPAPSWSSVASCAEVTGRGWRAAITSSTACWRAVRWLTESRGREVLEGPPGPRRRRASRDLRSRAMHRPLVVRRGSPRPLAAAPEPPLPASANTASHEKQEFDWRSAVAAGSRAQRAASTSWLIRRSIEMLGLWSCATFSSRIST